jgi:hypothetical protein
MATAKQDINSMTVEEIAAYLKARKETEAKDNWEKAVKAKAELEVYCKDKYGLSLAEIFTTPDKMPERKQYKNPEDGSIYAYSGRGKIPAWLKGSDGKPNAQFEVKSN